MYSHQSGLLFSAEWCMLVTSYFTGIIYCWSINQFTTSWGITKANYCVVVCRAGTLWTLSLNPLWRMQRMRVNPTHIVCLLSAHQMYNTDSVTQTSSGRNRPAFPGTGVLHSLQWASGLQFYNYLEIIRSYPLFTQGLITLINSKLFEVSCENDC